MGFCNFNNVVVQDYNGFKLDKEYYRNILRTYSIGEIVYTDRYYIDVETIVVLTLLKLIKKNQIELTKNGFIINDRNVDILKQSEAAILQSITEDGEVVVSGKLIREKVKQEIGKSDLLKKADSYRKFKPWEMIFIFIGALLFSLIIIKVNFWFRASALIKTIMDIGNVVFIAMIIPMFLYVYNRASLQMFVRTEKGEELNWKIKGLRKYLNDYMIDGKETSEIELWDDYGIYSVLTKTNETVGVELYNFIKIKNKYGITETLDEIF